MIVLKPDSKVFGSDPFLVSPYVPSCHRITSCICPRCDADILHNAFGGAGRGEESQVDQIIDTLGDQSVSVLLSVEDDNPIELMPMDN